MTFRLPAHMRTTITHMPSPVFFHKGWLNKHVCVSLLGNHYLLVGVRKRIGRRNVKMFRVGGAKGRMRQPATFTFSSLIRIIPTTENGNYFMLYNNNVIDIK